ncbi:Gldg family protein [Parahaliea aestuarii]|uniref:ABC transporter permease subunit n=1 Tax=Parahaliea aestuarii TaxID=1852021 RepID=A0A5C9A0Q6_9GAMM|nr:Gldg family protein [Parahaliea aestuarii]TXS94346.1 ABC transporter permease subunit [Parahaliea aestuarii]
MSQGVIRRVAARELGQYFGSPVAWLFLATFAAVSLFVFFWVESFFARNVADLRPLFQWMPLLLAFLCPALTMRAWSEERSQGTLEHLLTLPAGIGRFVLGKFLAVLTLLALALLATLPLPITVALIADLDPGPVAAGYLATLLLGAAYLAAGLLVSACTGNAIVALLGAVALCGGLYLLGSPLLTAFFDDSTAHWLRTLGSGARFESICRGVLDLRDLYYYVCLCGVFLTLNVYLLERSRWSTARSGRHRTWHAVTLLLMANFLLANLWLERLPQLRLDATGDQRYTLSDATRRLLDRLEQPLLLRGYFSPRQHPQLAPLVPRLQDLMAEYAAASGGRIKVEMIDPAEHPELEREAIDRYGMRARPFQVADRHQTALVNAWFQILINYGEAFETLGFNQLVEVRTAANRQAEVRLRNPEYNLTRALRDVLQRQRAGGDPYAGLDRPVELVAYVSDQALLPPLLDTYLGSIRAQLESRVAASDGMLSVRWVDPAADNGAVASRLQEERGVLPMTIVVGDGGEFFFHLTLEDGHQVIQLPTGDFDPTAFGRTLDAGLRRFADNMTRTVALALPPVQARMAEHHLGAPTFNQLERQVGEDYSLRMEQLDDGNVSPEADILAVLAPHQLSPRAVYAIDQFLMRGGTVILATSPFTAQISDGDMALLPWPSGLQDWLAFQGVNIGNSLVMDPQSSPFPVPVIRERGGQQFRDVHLLDFPYFLDLRPPGLHGEHPVTASLPQATMAWASPLQLTPQRGRKHLTLLRSSDQAWLSRDPDITPVVDQRGRTHFEPGPERGSFAVGAVLRGRFHSWYSEQALPTPEAELAPGAAAPPLPQLLEHSPHSARLVVFASNDFLDDQMLNASVAARGTQYSGALELFMNTLDWALQDDTLLSIRSRGQYNQTLPAMEPRAQRFIEYFNYALALAWLVLVAAIGWLCRVLRRRAWRRELAL